MLKNKMILTLILVVLITAVSFGCEAILVGDTLITSTHVIQQTEIPTKERIEVSNYDDLKLEMLNFVKQHEDSGRIYASYNGNVVEDVQSACDEIKNNDPLGAYAVSKISGIAIKVVSYFEIDVNIEYSRTKQQVDSIKDVSNQGVLQTDLREAMGNYIEEAVFHTTLNITEEYIDELVKEIYYKNPREIVVMPTVGMETFPDSGEDRIIELRFGYLEQASILSQYGERLSNDVKNHAAMASGGNDPELLLSSVENLIAACGYDYDKVRTIREHGSQNFAATAYGALAKGNAVGEGFAMAFKAICDQLNIDGCIVVLGYRYKVVHAWNIVPLNGAYYHIDVAMCAVNGIKTAFLKTDADLSGIYEWDRGKTVSCNGKLTYEDVAGVEEEEIPDEELGEPGEESGEPGEESGESVEQNDDETGQTSKPSEDEAEQAPETSGDEEVNIQDNTNELE